MPESLTFTEFVDRTGASLALIAKRCERTYPAIKRLYDGTLKPGLELALRIEDITLGTVKYNNWDCNSKSAN
ncbi:MAG: hypothetical protein OXG06_00755 [Gammaproteobacteria bacterium]|nr:hypothetical protein [Gammaproteobacteria bacterium]